jgi:hypothetical protein
MLEVYYLFTYITMIIQESVDECIFVMFFGFGTFFLLFWIFDLISALKPIKK